MIGNPPYVRYQDFSGQDRARSREAALRGGVRLTNLASSWAAFTVHAALFLRPGGRLALVLPAELLSVNYAAQVREFLMRRFGRVRLVLFTERVFPGVLEEVVLLLAEGTGPTDHCELVQVRDVDDLLAAHGGRGLALAAGDVRGQVDPGDDPGRGARGVHGGTRARRAGHPARVGRDHAGCRHRQQPVLRAVTAAGRPARSGRRPRVAAAVAARQPAPARVGADRSRLADISASTARRRCCSVPQGSRHRQVRPTSRAGQDAGVDAAYKCRVRKPWWRVPIVPPADLLLTYMNADTPRLTTNQARVHHLNSVHGVYLRTGLRRAGAQLLPVASLNSVTLLGAETVGRAYGGGMLKLEPREADLLPVPAPDAVAAARAELLAVRPAVAADLAAGRLLDAVVPGRRGAADRDVRDRSRRRPPAGAGQSGAGGSAYGTVRARIGDRARRRRVGSGGAMSSADDAFSPFDATLAGCRVTDPWRHEPGQQAAYAADYALLERLLGIPVSRGSAVVSGRFARAIDAWLAHELRRCGFGPDEVWPRPTRPRVLSREVAALAGPAARDGWPRRYATACRACPRWRRPTPGCSVAPTTSRSTSASPAGTAVRNCWSAPRPSCPRSARTCPTGSRRPTATPATCGPVTRWPRSASSSYSGRTIRTEEPDAYERTIDMVRKLRDIGAGYGYTATALLLVDWDDPVHEKTARRSGASGSATTPCLPTFRPRSSSRR